MYSNTSHCTIADQPFLWSDFLPYGKARKRTRPAHVLSRDARIAVMSIRQYFRQDLEHPADLWRDPDAVNAGEVVANLRNGASTATGILEGDANTVATIRAEEQKALAALDALELLRTLQAKAKYLETVLRGREKSTPEQIRYALTKVRRALDASGS